MSIIAIAVNRWFKQRVASALAANARPLVEPLEMRTLFNATPIVGALTPAQVQQAYGYNNILLPSGAPATGAGETIGIVDPYYDPDIQSDLHTFDVQYLGGLDPTFTPVNLGTSTNVDSSGTWEFSESLEVEWTHALAPQAKIVLVEAVSSKNTDLFSAVDQAVSLGSNVVVMPWGGSESSGEAAYDSHFANPNVTFVADSAAGSSPAPPWYPAVSPDVLSVGGTSLALDANGNWSSEVGYSQSDGGISAYEARPSYQPATYSNGNTTGIPLARRGAPDVAFIADLTSGLSVYDSYPRYNPSRYSGANTGWGDAYGTNNGAAGWAALIALADQGRAQAGENQLGTVAALSTLYNNPGDFHDITSGTSTDTGFSAGPGYDLVTGLGTPQAPLVVSSLVGVAPTSAPAAPNGLAATPGDGQVSLLWNASSSATSWNVYRSTDGINYTPFASVSQTSFVDTGLTDGNNYSYEVTAVNSMGESAPSASVTTSPQLPPAAPASLSAVGSANSYAVNLQWASSSGASSYNVLRTSTSASGYAVIASGVTGTSFVDSTVFAGRTYYYVVQAVSSAGAISANSTQASALVIPSIPLPISAIAGNSQVTLSWSPSTGATSYDILMSTTNGTGYTIVASNITSDSFTVTRLNDGTTYYFVIVAVNSAGSSPQSSQISAMPRKGKG